MLFNFNKYRTEQSFLLVFLLSCTPACLANSNEIDAIMEQAITDKNEGNYSEAENHMRQALTMSVASSGAMSSVTGKISRQLGDFYMNRGRYSDAERYFQRSLIIAAGYNGASSDSQGEFLNTRHFLSGALQNPGALPGSVEMANSLSGLASVYMRQDRYSDAEKMLTRVVEIYKSPGGSPLNYVKDSSDLLAQNLRSLAQVLYKEGKVIEAEDTFKTYVEGVRKDKGPSPQLAEALTHLSAFYRSQNRSSEADAADAEAKDLQNRFGRN